MREDLRHAVLRGRGFSHLHVHVVPRAPDLPPELRGPGVFALLGGPEETWVSEAEQDRLAVEIRAGWDRFATS